MAQLMLNSAAMVPAMSAGSKAVEHLMRQVIRGSTSAAASALWSRGYTTAPNDPFGSPPPLPQRRVVVTGIGIVSPVGVGVPVSWQTLVAGKTGTRQLQPEDLPEVRFAVLCKCLHWGQPPFGYPRVQQ